jgi:hypothetical protein
VKQFTKPSKPSLCFISFTQESEDYEDRRTDNFLEPNCLWDNLIPFSSAVETKGRGGSVVEFERRTVPCAFGGEGYFLRNQV